MIKPKKPLERSTRIAQRIAIGSAAVVILGIVFLVTRQLFPGNPWTASECGKLEKTSASSPDGSRLAQHILFVCGAGLTQQVWDAVVVVQRGQNPVKGDEVWTGDTQSQGQIVLSWKTADRLQVTLPVGSYTNKQKTSRDGLVIEY